MAFDMGFDLQGFGKAVEGQYSTWHSDLREAVLTANRAAVEEASIWGRDKFRADLRNAGLGSLEKTWRTDLFPRRGLAWDPAALIYSNADIIVGAFDEGATIRPRDGGKLAIPLPYFNERLPKTRNQHTKSEVELAKQMYGEENLVVLPADGTRPAIIALRSGTITTTGRISKRKLLKSGKHGKKAGVIPLLVLVDEVHLKKRLDIQAGFREVEVEFFRRYTRYLAREINSKGLAA